MLTSLFAQGLLYGGNHGGAFIPHPRGELKGNFLHSQLHWSARPGFGGEYVGFESEGIEPFELDRIQWPIEPSHGTNPEDGDVFELAGDHEGRGTGRGFVVPPGGGALGLFNVFSELALDEFSRDDFSLLTGSRAYPRLCR